MAEPNNAPTPQAGGQTPPLDGTPGQTPNTTPQGGQTPPNGQQPNQPPNTRTTLDALPQDVQDMIRDLRHEAKQLRQARDADAAAKAQAEQDRLKAQGEYKQLAETTEAKVKELEPIAERYKALTEQLGDQIKEQIKDWPPSVKALDPGKDAPIEARLEWVNKSRAIVEQLAVQARGQAPGNGPSPQPATPGAQSAASVEELRTRFRASGRYGL